MSEGATRAPERSAALEQLEILVGTWRVTGAETAPDEIQGQVRFEWLPGRYFMVQHVDLVHGGQHNTGIEIIGHERGWFAAAPSKELTSRYFDSDGNTFDYTWEVDERSLTIWGGPKGSPAAFRGRFDDDHTTVTGRWEWPGGGYAATMTRVA